MTDLLPQPAPLVNRVYRVYEVGTMKCLGAYTNIATAEKQVNDYLASANKNTHYIITMERRIYDTENNTYYEQP